MFNLDLGNAKSPNGNPMGEQTVKEVSNTEGIPVPLTIDLNCPDTAQPQGGDMSGNIPALTSFQLLLTTPDISFPDPDMRH